MGDCVCRAINGAIELLTSTQECFTEATRQPFNRARGP